MLLLVLRRAAHGLLVMLAALAVLFCLIAVVPGDPASVVLGPHATLAQKAALRHDMHLDQPILLQFAGFVWRLLHGDLGTDVLTRTPVAQLVFQALPHTAALAASAIAWALLIGLPLGCMCALRRDGWLDRTLALASAACIAFPTSLVAIYALLLFAVRLHWFPAIGAGRPGDLPDQLWHLALPSLTLGVGWIGYLCRLMRTAMLENLGADHVRTARAFGLGEARIAMRFVLPIAVVPVIAVLGVGIGSLLSGAVLVEMVFDRPGLGLLTYDAVLARNFPVILGAVLVTAPLYLLSNLAADLLIACLDPRVRAHV
jgi:peptide/nickel transport system permease protein